MGGNGDDFLTGTTFRNKGVGEVDTLTGGQDADIFVLGDSQVIYYDDGNSYTTGENDYALIADFTLGVDKIKLAGLPVHYRLVEGARDTSIYLDKVIPGYEENELIGIVNNVTGLNLNDSSMFIYE